MYEPIVRAQPSTPETKIDSTYETNPIDSKIVEDEITEDKPLMLLGMPFVANIYGFDEDYKENIDNMKDKLELIDTYLKTQILQKKWKPTIKSYKEALVELEEHLNLGENMTEYDKVEMIYLYLKGKYRL